MIWSQILPLGFHLLFYILKPGVCHIKKCILNNIQILSRFICPTMFWLLSSNQKSPIDPAPYQLIQHRNLDAVGCSRQVSKSFFKWLIYFVNKVQLPNCSLWSHSDAAGYPAAAPEQCRLPTSQIWYSTCSLSWSMLVTVCPCSYPTVI